MNAISLQYTGKRETACRLVKLRVLSLVKLLCGKNHFLSSLWPTANGNGTHRAAAPADSGSYLTKPLSGKPDGRA